MFKLIDGDRQVKDSDAYNKFLTNLCDGREGELQVMLNNSLINQCIRNGYNSGMTEIETLRAAILAMIHVSDKDLEDKIKAAMMSCAPPLGARGES